MLELVGIGLVQIAWWEPPHSCGGARLSSRAARVGLFSSGFSRGVLKPGLKPDGSKCGSFRDAEAECTGTSVTLWT